ncbi:MAG TPA: PAS domain S-box protein [Blastocatellia bacterium]|nr:PAS domain S-box protein [Blastocatellia bacterium]
MTFPFAELFRFERSSETRSDDRPEVSGRQLEEAFDAITLGNLRLILPFLTVLFLVFAVSHLLVMQGRAALVMSLVALTTALLMVWLRWRILQPQFPLAQARLTGGMVVGLVWMNALLQLALTRDPHQATNLLLLICGVGIYSLSLGLVLIVLAASVGGWALIAATLVPENAIHFAFGFATAALLAITSTIFRIRFFQGLETFRRNDERKRQALTEALASTEKAWQDADTSRLALEAMLTAMHWAEERFRSFTGLEGIAIHKQGDILDANPALAEMFGYDPLEITRTSAPQLIAPESRRAVQEFLVSGEEGPHEAVGLRKDGTTFPVEICSAATQYRGRAASVISIRDITDRHEVMTRLRESEERYRELFELTPLPMAVIDRETLTFLAVNQAAIQHYGYSRSEFIGLPVTALYRPEDRPKLIERFGQERRGLSSHRAAVQQKKDGTIIEVELIMHAITWGGKPARLVLASDVTDRNRIEKELRTSEARYRQLFDASPLPMWVYDLDTFAFLAVNQAALNKYGWSREEFLSMTSLDIRSAEEGARLRHFTRTGLKGRQHAGIWEHRKKDGTIIQADIISDDFIFEGKAARLVIANDVTERLRREQQLRESEERYRQLFDISPIPMWVFDVETLKFLAVNKAAIRHYGYSRQEFLAMSSADIRPPEERERYIAMASKDPKGIRNSGTWKHRRKDGSEIEVVISSHELTFAGRRARMVVANDITARKRVEEALRQYTDRLLILREIDQAILAAQSPEAIANAVLPRLQQLIPCDQACVRTYDLHQQEAVRLAVVSKYETTIAAGTRLPLLKSSLDDLQSGRQLLIEDLQKFTGTFPGLEDLRAEGMRSFLGVPIKAQGRLIASLNLSDRQPGAFTHQHQDIARDIASTLGVAIQNAQLYEAERRARAEAEAADRMKDEFLATVSHELRTPLNAIVGWNHLLRNKRLAPDVAQRALETIERNAKAQARLVNDLLDVSRIISGRLRLCTRTLDLIPLIEDTINSVRPAAEAKGISIETFLDPAAGLVSGDSDRLQQVLWNLLQNSIKFTPPGGRVSLTLGRADDQLQLVISDNGKGISPDFLPYVFERFRQADSSITRIYGGLGLGLSIVRHLVELHGGTVRATSPGEGLGATFTIRLPLAELRVSDAGLRIESSFDNESAALKASPVLLGGTRILIVEDEADTRELLALLLSQQGAATITVASAEEGLTVLRQWQPDLLISDLAMTGRDGYWLIGKVRELAPAQGGRIPAIALTAYARAEDRTRTLAAGFQSHLAKPFEPEELTQAAVRLLGRAAGSKVGD